MKRILFFLLLLVNLHLTTDNGSLSIGLGEVVAQRVQEERLSKVTTRGGGDVYYCNCGFTCYDEDTYSYHVNNDCTWNVLCKDCNHYVWRCDMWEHQNYECPYRWEYCTVCHKEDYAINIENGNHCCNMPCYCVWCKRRLPFGEGCTCFEATVYGQRKVSEDEWNSTNHDNQTNEDNGNGNNYGGGGKNNKKPHKDNINKNQLTQKWREEGYDREFDPDKCRKCLAAWKLVHQKCGLGEYAGTVYAKNFGPKLEQYGYKCIYSGNSATCPSGYTPQLGDTRVWESHPEQKEPAGHIDWWNGTNWVSDFKENNWYPGKRYKKYKVSYKIYR